MPFEGALADRVLIRERMSEYADSMFQRDLGAWLANFTEDCLWRGNGMEMRGLDALGQQPASAAAMRIERLEFDRHSKIGLPTLESSSMDSLAVLDKF